MRPCRPPLHRAGRPGLGRGAQGLGGGLGGALALPRARPGLGRGRGPGPAQRPRRSEELGLGRLAAPSDLRSSLLPSLSPGPEPLPAPAQDVPGGRPELLPSAQALGPSPGRPARGRGGQGLKNQSWGRSKVQFLRFGGGLKIAIFANIAPSKKPIFETAQDNQKLNV